MGRGCSQLCLALCNLWGGLRGRKASEQLGGLSSAQTKAPANTWLWKAELQVQGLVWSGLILLLKLEEEGDLGMEKETAPRFL